MAKHNKYQAEYLSFTKTERIGMMVVVLLMIIYPAIPLLYAHIHSPQRIDHGAFEKEIAELNIKEPESTGYTKRNYDRAYDQYNPSEKNYNNITRGELFYFDPNTLPVAGWKKLGVREKTASTIQNYISKGGRFYKGEDISKIWGLHEGEVKRLLPYVRIEARSTNAYNKYPDTEKEKPYNKPKYTIATVDINHADTSAYIALPGIGSKLAARIIAFREKLGGFYKIEQVAETYGLPDSTFQKIKAKLVIADNSVKKLNINTASIDELKIHPYLRYNIANAIVQYRLQHGNFSAVSDIKKIMMLTDDIYNKFAPYISVK